MGRPPEHIRWRDIQHRWYEPFFMMMRLQGEVGRRLIFAGTIWVTIFFACAFLVLLTRRATAFDAFKFSSGVSLMVGLFVCFGVFVKTKRPAGNVILTAQRLRLKHYISGLYMDEERWQDWPYPAIEQCGVVTPEKMGHNFGALVLIWEDKIEMIGVPRRTDLRVIANFLTSRGVMVTPLNRLPQSVILEPSVTNLKLAVAGVVAGSFLFVVLVQLIIKLVR